MQTAEARKNNEVLSGMVIQWSSLPIFEVWTKLNIKSNLDVIVEQEEYFLEETIPKHSAEGGSKVK